MRIVKEECYRALSGRNMKICLLISFLLAAGQVVCFYYFHVQELEFQDYPTVLYQSYIGEESHTPFHTLYFSLIPILAVLPFAGSFYYDTKTGYIKNLCCRVPKSKYLLAKYLAVYISGAVGAVLPNILSFLLTALFYPAQKPYVLSLQVGVQDISMFSEYFYTKPLLYMFLCVCIIMVFGGALAVISLSITYYAKNVLVVLFLPYIIYTIQDLLTTQAGLAGWSWRQIIDPCSEPIYPSMITKTSILCNILFLLFITLLSFLFIGCRRDTVEWQKN